ncbi:MAG: Gfo/Idh/MocA family oxidoreductase [Acidimicrobiia bacterium]
MSGDLRVLLVGAGRAGMVHGRNLAGGLRGARLVSIADASRSAREQAAAELGCQRTFSDPAAAVTDDAVDAVVVATPTFTHAEVVVPALEAGKHVLCEKPLAASLEEADRMAVAAASSRSVFLIGFMRRFDSAFTRAADRVAAGDIGRPLLVRSTGRGPGLPPEWAWDVSRSGGLIAEVNSHDLDTVRWMSGQEFVGVHAFGRAAKRPDLAELHPGFVDVVVASFEMDGGALAQVDGACPAGYGYDARAEVYGTEGTLLVGGPALPTPLLVRKGEAVTDPVAGWRDLFAEAYRAEVAHFLAAARGEEAPRTGVVDGVRALEAALAVNRSLAEGSTARIEDLRR